MRFRGWHLIKLLTVDNAKNKTIFNCNNKLHIEQTVKADQDCSL